MKQKLLGACAVIALATFVQAHDCAAQSGGSGNGGGSGARNDGGTGGMGSGSGAGDMNGGLDDGLDRGLDEGLDGGTDRGLDDGSGAGRGGHGDEHGLGGSPHLGGDGDGEDDALSHDEFGRHLRRQMPERGIDGGAPDSENEPGTGSHMETYPGDGARVL